MICQMCFECAWFPCLADDDDVHDEVRAKKTKEEAEAMNLEGDKCSLYSRPCPFYKAESPKKRGE